jgi:F-type H+-transporting ATPase subunit epsilon
MSFKLTIMTPEGAVFDDDVDSFVAPASHGYFGVLTNHAPMVSLIGSGTLKVDALGDTRYFAVAGGIAEVTNAGATVLADLVKKVSSPDEAEIELDKLSGPAPDED